VLDLAHDAAAGDAALGQVAHDVLGHDHGAVHDDPEVDGAERQEVGGDRVEVHEDEGEEQGERDGERHEDRGADVVEEQREQQDHQRGALDQVLHHGADGRVHQPLAVVVRAQLHPGRENLLDVLQLPLDAVDDGARVLALAHAHDAAHHVVVVVAAEHAEANGVADAHRAEVAHAHGRPARRRHHDVLDVARGLDHADAAHGERVLTPRDIGAAGVGVVGGDGVEDLLEGQVVRAQPHGIDGDLVLLDAAAPRDDVGHAGHLEELALQHPVLQRLQLDQGHGGRPEGVAIHLADDAREGAEGRARVGRDLGAGDPLLHLLARPVLVGAVGEEHADVREAEQRRRPQKCDVGDAVQLLLELDRDEPLDLLGGVALPERDDLHGDVADVGIGLDGQARPGQDPARRQQQRQRQRDEALVQREGDEPRDHLVAFLSRMLPVVTTRSSGVTPSRISTEPLSSPPSCTGFRA